MIILKCPSCDKQIAVDINKDFDVDCDCGCIIKGNIFVVY
jgi:hypothetical protein